jgi:DNA-binding MurR/RpiR family transcriptional regulator
METGAYPLTAANLKLNTKQAFIQHILDKQDDYTKVYRKLANVLLNRFVDVAFMTAQQWAASVDTSEVSVIRFVRFLGFNGYPEFAENLRQIIRNEMTMVNYAELSINKRSNKQTEDDNLLLDIIKTEEQNFNELIAKFSPQTMSEVVDLLSNAERLVIIGLRSSAALATYGSYMFMRALGKETITINDSGEHMYDCLLPLESKKVVVIAFGYPRYPAKLLDLVRHLKKFHFPVISITGDELSPLVALSDHVIYAPSHSVSFTDSMGAATVIINTIVLEYMNKFHEKSLDRIKQFETLASEKNYYWKG